MKIHTYDYLYIGVKDYYMRKSKSIDLTFKFEMTTSVVLSDLMLRFIAATEAEAGDPTAEDPEAFCLKNAMPGKAETSPLGSKGKLRGILEAKGSKSAKRPKETSK